MSKIINLLSLVFILKLAGLNAQNVGIGTNSPLYKLDVAGTMRIQNSTSTAGLWFDGTSLATKSFIGTLNDNHFGIYGNGGAGWNFLINNVTNNVGIGTSAPLFRLDINGRMRLQNDANTAGIWFDGSTLPLRSFIGTMNDSYTGIYGGGGAGWNFVMDVANGNIGIGTAAPTKKLDLNGTLRIRSDAPMKGSVLTSKDQNGNSEWTNPIAFKSEGTTNNVPVAIANNTWAKIQFNQSPAYNLGNYYQPSTSEFLVPVNGIYEFQSGITFQGSNIFAQSIRIILQRNGVNSTINQLYNKGIYIGNSQSSFDENLKISVEANLQAGDKIWVEAFQAPYSFQTTEVYSSPVFTWFSGNLISKI
jgi:C1q domain